jgi:mannosyltransferase
MMREMSRSSSWIHWLLLAAIMALAMVLRLWQINESLWVDELHTSWCVQGGFSQVAERAAVGNQSPLYFYLMWGVTRLLGESEFTLRLPSLLAGIALPGMTWLLVRRAWRAGNEEGFENDDERGVWSAREWPALLAAFLVAVDHASIFYSTEARPYACLELLAVVVLLAALNDQFCPSQASPLYLILASAALFYCHYTAALYLAGIFAVLLVWAIFLPSEKYNWQSWLVDVGGIAAICAPALKQTYDIASRRENWGSFIDQPTLADLVTTFPFVAAPAGLLVLYFWRSSPKLPRSLPLLGCAAVLPIVIAWTLSYLDVVRLFHSRYLVSAFPALWAAVAIASQIPPSRTLRVISTIAIAGLAVGYFLAEGRFLIDRREDWPSAIVAAEQVHQQHPGWKILVHSGLMETDALRQPHDDKLRKYGLLPVKALYPLNVEDRDLIPLPMSDPGKLIGEVREDILRASGTVIILRLSAVDAVAVEEDLVQSLAEKDAAVTVIGRQAFGDVQVITVQVSGSTTKELAPGSSPNERLR